MVELSYRPLSKLALASRSSGARAEAPVHLWELPRRTMVTLRLDPRDTGLVERAETALGLALPRQPNRLTTDAKDGFVLWTSPDEFMIDLPGAPAAQGAAAEGAAARIEALSGALAADFASVVEVSDQMAGIGLGGSHWREVWSKVSALDLHESQFAPGACAQTLTAKSNVLLYAPNLRSGRVAEIRLYTRRSFSQYLFLRLEDAAQEYGLTLHAF